MEQDVAFNAELIERYDVAGPRYTSYPTAVQFSETFGVREYRRHAAASNRGDDVRPLSLYLHLPFCHSLCYYCGCMKKVTRHAHHAESYLELLWREIEMQAALFDDEREVTQLHLGGGTPTYYDDEQLAALLGKLGKHFRLDRTDQREFSIEIDPRTVTSDRLSALSEIGFNRISMGVQDIDPRVQAAVNRIQDPQATLDLIDQARRLQFRSISIDLIYGLPLQTVESFNRTIDYVLEARPNRLAVYNYAHMPHLFRAQRMIDPGHIPSPVTKLELMELTITRLTEAGYVYIGMDHFALPDDELTLAQREGGLQRNFQGYSTRRECDLIGLGVSAIGRVGDCYAQNRKTLPEWSEWVGSGEMPVWRGIALTPDDVLRRTIIETVMCHGELDYDSISRQFSIEFPHYFADSLHGLEQLQHDGLIRMNPDGFETTAEGRLLLRPIAMVFDAYLRTAESAPKFSRVI